MSSRGSFEDVLTRCVEHHELVAEVLGAGVEGGELAFKLVSRVSQDTNRKLFQVAEDLVVTGEVRRHASR